jgi:hypothetical protein
MLGWGWTTFLVVVAVLAFLVGLAEPTREITPAERRRLAARARVAGAEPEPEVPGRRRGGGAYPTGQNAARSRRSARAGLAANGRSSLARRDRHAARAVHDRRAGPRTRGLPASRRT